MVTFWLVNQSPDSKASTPAAQVATSSTSSTVAGRTSAATEPTAAASSATVTQSSAAKSAAAATCPATGQLTVAAAPEIAAVIRQLPAGSCRLAVSDQSPATLAAAVRADPAAAPDIWIPDSSGWVTRAAAAGLPLPTEAPSIATSPVVIALSSAAAEQLTASGAPLDLPQLLKSATTSAPVRLGLPDPHQYVPSVAALLGLQAFQTTASTDRAALAWGLRSSPDGLPTDSTALLAQLATNANIAMPASEEAVWRFDQTATTPARVIYGATAGVQLDYPFVVLSSDPVTRTAAAALLGDLQQDTTRNLFLTKGFRDAAGNAGPAIAATPGLNAIPQPPSGQPNPAAVDTAMANLAAVNEPSRLLAIMDVSGSMAAQVPGAGGKTRLELAKAAAGLGLGLYPADSEIGLWIFSRHLTATTDYQQVVTVGPLGGAGAQVLAQAIGAVQVNPDGATGLYDTTLDAVRQMRATWDPSRVNLVLILSDGKNQDAGSISLPDLVATLHSEADPARPVPVIAIAFGPDSDVDAMTQITTATGGKTYLATDPRDITNIFLDAVAERLCRPNC